MKLTTTVTHTTSALMPITASLALFETLGNTTEALEQWARQTLNDLRYQECPSIHVTGDLGENGHWAKVSANPAKDLEDQPASKLVR